MKIPKDKSLRELSMTPPEKKYLIDPIYHALVDTLERMLSQSEFTPSEIQEAATYACIRYESKRNRVRVISIGKEPKNEIKSHQK